MRFSWPTCVYPGGEDCLPYDGSPIPDCLMADNLYSLYYYPHSTSKKNKFLVTSTCFGLQTVVDFGNVELDWTTATWPACMNVLTVVIRTIHSAMASGLSFLIPVSSFQRDQCATGQNI